jgi:hypothetical protein
MNELVVSRVRTFIPGNRSSLLTGFTISDILNHIKIAEAVVVNLDGAVKLSEVVEILDAATIEGQDRLDLEVTSAAASDLMSDLLRHPRDGALLLTGLSSIQVIRTCVVSSIVAVVFVRGKKPDDAMRTHAREYGLPLFSTPLNMYTSCGKLFSHGLPSIR